MSTKMAARGLSNSRWATSSSYRTHSLPPSNRLEPPSSTHTPSGNPSPRSAGSPAPQQQGTAHLPNYITASALPPAAELARYEKIVRRLKWKLPPLAAGYRQAVVYAADPTADALAGTFPGEAELMFKLDFFEYYMLCERALVHLLSVYGLAPERGNAPQHRYHAAVLEALADAANPLHEALGKGEVRRQLYRAKDLRNRWKNADADGEEANNGVNGGTAGATAPWFRTPAQKERDAAAARPSLESFDLEHILVTIFNGFDEAYNVAHRYVAELQSEAKDTANGEEAMDGVDDGQWDFMVDAMDWEAV